MIKIFLKPFVGGTYELCVLASEHGLNSIYPEVDNGNQNVV